MVPAFHGSSPIHTYLQLAVRLLPANQRHQANNASISWRSGTRYSVHYPRNCHLLTLQQWDSNSLWESRYIWLPVAIDESRKSLQVEWHDIYDLNM
jgi:hypothetical protein